MKQFGECFSVFAAYSQHAEVSAVLPEGSYFTIVEPSTPRPFKEAPNLPKLSLPGRASPPPPAAALEYVDSPVLRDL